jgi:ubiquitin-conjugating enzyme E2 G1
MSNTPAAGLLARQLKQMQTDKDIPGISCGLADNNIFEWEVMLMINDECKFYGGTIVLQRLYAGILIYFQRGLFPSTIIFSI